MHVERSSIRCRASHCGILRVSRFGPGRVSDKPEPGRGATSAQDYRSQKKPLLAMQEARFVLASMSSPTEDRCTAPRVGNGPGCSCRDRSSQVKSDYLLWHFRQSALLVFATLSSLVPAAALLCTSWQDAHSNLAE